MSAAEMLLTARAEVEQESCVATKRAEVWSCVGDKLRPSFLAHPGSCATNSCPQINMGSEDEHEIWFTDSNLPKTHLDKNCILPPHKKETFLHAKMLSKT